MPGETLFISDLHLDRERPEVVALFQQFATRCRDADALYILGDLFEAWIGDDEDTDLANLVCETLRGVGAAGTPVFVMRGNRDFLMGEGFTARSGATLLPDPTRIDLYGETVLLTHGDQLCTDDVDYQRLRSMLHDPAWQADFLGKDLAERRAMAAALRARSREAIQAKAEFIMDVNQDAVARCMREHGVLRMIHGHTHRPAVHDFDLDDRSARRIVLGDWYEQGSVLRCTERGCALSPLELR